MLGLWFLLSCWTIVRLLCGLRRCGDAKSKYYLPINVVICNEHSLSNLHNLTVGRKFGLNHTTAIKENCGHDLNFFTDFDVVFSLRRLLTCSYVLLINPCLILRYYALLEGGVISISRKHVFGNWWLVFFCKKSVRLEQVLLLYVSCPKRQLKSSFPQL